MIHLTHGVVPNWNSERISHALFLPEQFFAAHLEQRLAKYVPLEQALTGEGDALTIDDATYGGLQAALLALKYGHAVSWFVNGLHVDRGLQYFPFQLSSFIDDSRLDACWFNGQNWALGRDGEGRALRRHLKQRYMRMRKEEEIAQLVEDVSSVLETDPAMERSLCTVTSAELSTAVAAGVDLQNHSWRHLNPQLFSEFQCTGEALLNEDYLSQFRGTKLRAYAPPFGQPLHLTRDVSDVVLLADRLLFSNHSDGKIVNRQDLLAA